MNIIMYTNSLSALLQSHSIRNSRQAATEKLFIYKEGLWKM
jgi:hypothetical protein